MVNASARVTFMPKLALGIVSSFSLLPYAYSADAVRCVLRVVMQTNPLFDARNMAVTSLDSALLLLGDGVEE